MEAVVDSEELALWKRLRATADTSAREQLLALHLPYARIVAAAYFSRRFHDEIEFGDYLQYASLGLLEAMERFDPERGAQFRTFAARRMHGSILDGIERLTEKQQQISARQRLRAERLHAVEEMAQQRTHALSEGDRLIRYVTEAGIGLALAWMLDGTGMVDEPERAECIPFYRNAEMRQLRERLLREVDELPVQERVVVRSHYLQDMPFERVASMLSLTKGRISQIHRQALLRLRETLAEHGCLDVSL